MGGGDLAGLRKAMVHKGGEAKGCFAASKEETGGDREKEKGNGAKKGWRRRGKRKTKTDGLKEKKG